MTNEQRDRIAAMRRQDYGYIKIAQALGLSDNTVRSYCRRNGLDKGTMYNINLCKKCRKPIKITGGCKPKIFCSDACRTQWWNSHLDSVDKRAIYHFICANCGKSFSAYGNKTRKYCRHDCYIAARFGEGRLHYD